MSFLNRSVSPIRRSNSPVAWQCETELSDSYRAEEDKVYVNNNEGMETSTFPHRVADGCQEQLNGSGKDNVSYGSSLMNTEEKRPSVQPVSKILPCGFVGYVFCIGSLTCVDVTDVVRRSSH